MAVRRPETYDEKLCYPLSDAVRFLTCLVDTLTLKMSVGSDNYQLCLPIMGQTPTRENVG